MTAGPGQRLATWAGGLRPRTIALAGWLVFLLYAYPGYMTSDSVDQLIDSRLGSFNDWHSPTMTEVWRLVGFAIAGPFGMLALQSLLVLAGVYALLARIARPRAAALGAAGLLIFPPVMTTMAAIWQDSQMAGFLLAGLAAITSRRRGWTVCGIGLLVLAAAMRPSAALAVLPLVVAGVHARDADHPVLATRGRRLAVTLVTWAAIWLAALGLDAGLRSAETGHTRLELATADLLGVTHYAPAIDDARARDLLAGIALHGDHLQDRISAAYGHTDKLTGGSDPVFEAPKTAEDRAPVIDAAWRLASSYPGAYLRHRWHTWFRVLGLRRNRDNKAVYVGFTGSAFQGDQAAHTAQHAAVQHAMIAATSVIANSRMNRPYLYLALAIVLLPLALRRRHALAVSLLASGLGYELSLFFVALGSQYALSHWLITATSFALALIVRGELAARRARRATVPVPAAPAAPAVPAVPAAPAAPAAVAASPHGSSSISASCST